MVGSVRLVPGQAGRIRIGLLISNISRLGGGVSSSVVKLAQALRQADFEAVIFTARDRHLQRDRRQLVGIKIVSRPLLGPAAIGYLPGLLADMVRADIAILHLHGIWQYPSIAGQMWQRQTGRPYIVSPHGMLEDWILNRGRAKKWLAKLVYEKSNLTRASLVHALTGAEAGQAVRFAPGAKTIVIPNGIEIAGLYDRPAPDPYVLYLGRFHPKKNLQTAIEAWGALGDERGTCRFSIAGWGDDADLVETTKRIEALGPNAGIDYLGPIYGQEKQHLLAGARFVLLPSLSEGLPMTILEAWAEGVPALMSSYCNLPEGFAAGAALDCGTTVDTIHAALARALAMKPEDRRTMSESARELATRKFLMAVVTETWVQTYRELLASPGANEREHLAGLRNVSIA
jgi:glycosyltransferase involved in cell wall biosynthesis